MARDSLVACETDEDGKYVGISSSELTYIIFERLLNLSQAVQPTEKSYRPSHRASIQGSIIHDASYFATLELKGPQFILEYILGLICDLQGAGAGATRCILTILIPLSRILILKCSWVVGSRAFNTHLHKCDSYPFGCLGPATIIWRPSNTQNQSLLRPGSLQKNNEPSTDCVATTPDNKTTRYLWLRVHPAIFEDVTVELKKAVSRALDRPRPPPEEFEVEIADLRGQVNAFEIMGPKSNQVLRGALDPISKDDRNVFKQVCLPFKPGREVSDSWFSFGRLYIKRNHPVRYLAT